MGDTISRHGTSAWLENMGHPNLAKMVMDEKRFPSAQLSTNLAEVGTDCISRQAAIDALAKFVPYAICDESTESYTNGLTDAYNLILQLPSVQPDHNADFSKKVDGDCISRQAAIDIVEFECGEWRGLAKTIAEEIEQLPSVQQERTCVNCGRTANNGGWYADGRTRCPIEEHYALPKDGYCHLWEKRNVTDDDYPERREE